MEWYLMVLRKYADFSGRARRKEYWMFALFSGLISIALGLLDRAFGFKFTMQAPGVLEGLYSLFIIIPSLALVCRRLHDVGKSGWFFLIILIPIIGAIWLFVLMVTDSHPGTNKWGPNPKFPETDANNLFEENAEDSI